MLKYTFFGDQQGWISQKWLSLQIELNETNDRS